MKSVEIKIKNEVGLHARPATLFVQESQKYKAEINVNFNGNSINAKSLLSLLSLGVTQGSSIDIQADGVDEEEALINLVELIEGNFGE